MYHEQLGIVISLCCLTCIHAGVQTTPPQGSTTPFNEGFPNFTTTGAVAGTSCDSNLLAQLFESQFFSTKNYPSNYDSDMNCKINISAPADTAIELTFIAFLFEFETYCSYDYFAVYDGMNTSATMIGKYCGSDSPGTIHSSSNSLYIVIYTDESVETSGASVTYGAIDNSYPACKSRYTSGTATGTIQTISNSNSPYLSNEDEYFLIENPTSGDLILQLTAMSVERASDCIYDHIILYNGACTKDTVLDKHCGTFLKRWELTGAEYLLHFHTDSNVERNGFTMEYFLGISGTGEPTTTTTTIGPPISAEVVLMNDVLANYSSGNFPVKDLSIAVETSIEVYIASVNGLDEVQQKLTTTILFQMVWYDEGMKWPTSKQSGISKLLIPQNDIWKPDLALLNSFAKSTQLGHKFMFVVVENNGKCTWRPYQILESTCKTDMADYPYDTQECDLKFSTWSSTSSQVRTVVGSNGMTKLDTFVENSEWHLQGISQRNETINGQLTAVFSIKLKRNPSFIVFYITIPVILLSLLNSLTFALPVMSGEKAGYTITVFLSFLVYVIVTFKKMPENSDTISLFAMYILIMTGLSSLTVIISVLEIRMAGLKTKHKPVIRYTVSFTKLILNMQQRFLCIRDKVELRQFIEEEKNLKQRNGRSNIEEDDEDDADDDVDNAWPEFVSALDFICFWVFLVVTVLLTCGFMGYLSVQ